VSTVCGDEVVSAFLDLTPIVGVGKELIQEAVAVIAVHTVHCSRSFK
jgi:hypothetical protein